MSDGLYVGMSGAASRVLQLDAIADNLANANTPGYKAERPVFEHVLGSEANGSGPAIDHVHSAVAGTALDLSPGLTTTTGRALDVVPEGRHMLAVLQQDGSIAYTRRGSLQVDAQGILCSNGRPVVGVTGGQVIVPAGAPAQITQDGTVRVGDAAVDRLALFELSGPVDRVGPGLLAPGNQGGTAAPVAAPKFRVGEVEQSNVNALAMTVELISAQRHFENAMQALSTYRRMDDKMLEVARLR